MNRHLPLPPCPSEKNWEICDPAFDPESLWNSESMGLVKEAARRKVFCCKGYYIKAFKLAHSAISLFRDPAKKEWKIATRLHIGSLTAPPVAYGKSGCWSYFAASEIKGPNLESFLCDKWPGLTRFQKKEIIKLFAGFLAALSEAGLFQPDFHLNNVIYNSEKRRFFLIDLHRAHFRSRPLMAEERLKQLSYILPPFWGKVSRHEILRFVAILSHDWTELKARSLRYQVQEHAFSRMRRHWSKKGRRRIQGFLKQKRNNRRLLLSSRQTPNEVIRFIEDLSNKNIPIKKSAIKSSRHTMADKVEIGGSPYFLKLYRCSGHLNAGSYLFRTSRAIKTWNISWEFIVRQVPTPLPLAAVDTGDPWNEIYGAAIYVWIDAGRHNTDMIKRTLKDREAAPGFLSKLSGFVWEMHEKGVFHGDCKISNFYFDPSSPTTFKIFDLDGAKIKRQLSDRERLSDLINLCASLEWWRVRDKLTKEIFTYYTRRCINWAERQDLLHLLETKVTQKIRKRKLRTDQESAKGPRLYDF
jgi:tRNA A-37 threonylcarbamoyl transferase component Bud32